MSLRKTALLAIVLVATLLYIFRVLEPGKLEESQAKVIFRQLAQDKITSLHVRSAQGEYTLVHEISAPPSADVNTSATPPAVGIGTWRLQGLEKAPLDLAKLNSIVTAITNLSSEQAIEPAEIDSDKSVYGLSQPELTLDLNTATKNYTIKFGKENAYVGKRYVSIEPDGPALMLAPDALFATAAVKADDVRSKMPLQISDSEVKSIEVRAAKDVVKVQRADGSTVWKIVAPIEAKAADAVVLQLIRDLRNLRTEEFIERTPQNISANGLDSAAIEVNIEFSNNRPALNLKIAPAKPEAELKPAFFVIDDQPGIYKTSNFERSSVAKSLLDLRDREMFVFDRTKLEKLSFQSVQDGETKHQVEKAVDGKWIIDSKPADQVFVGELLGNLNSLKALDFSLAPAQAFEKPQLTITIGVGGANEQTLIIGAETKPASKQFYARSSSRDEDFVISAETLRLITPRVEALLAQPTPTPLSAAATNVPEASAAVGSAAPSQPTGGAGG